MLRMFTPFLAMQEEFGNFDQYSWQFVGGSRNVLTSNHFSGQGIGIDEGNHNLVARNVVVDPRKSGIKIGNDFADRPAHTAESDPSARISNRAGSTSTAPRSSPHSCRRLAW